MQIALIHNPCAGNSSQRRLQALRHAFERRGHDVRSHDSLSFCRDRDRDGIGADCLCIVGGDGTARMVVDAQCEAQSDATVSIMPSGTINLVARELGYPAHPEAFVKLVESERAPEGKALGRVNDTIFLACVSVGPDSITVANTGATAKRYIGRFAYALSFLRLLWFWPRPHLNVEVDGTGYAAQSVFVLNARYYAGPWSLDRLASLDVPGFRVVILPKAGRWDYIRLFFYALAGCRWPDARWLFLSANTISIRSHDRWPVQVDGDILTHTPVALSICPTQVRFL